MRPPIEQPAVESDDPVHGTTYRHPAYGAITLSRVVGNGQVLHGSDFEHHATMRIRISRAALKRNLSQDWHFPIGQEEIVEVSMSEAQWVTFVASAGVGAGVPCTIDTIFREPQAQLPPPASRTEQFSGELREKMRDALDAVADARSLLAGLKVSRAAEVEIRKRLSKIEQSITSSAVFVADSFDEHMEATVEKAKVEVHAYTMHHVIASGLASLKAAAAPLQLPSYEEVVDEASPTVAESPRSEP